MQMPVGPAPLCSHSSPIAAPAQHSECSLFRVACTGGIALRSGPHFDAPRTGITLMQNQIISVSQEIKAYDGRVYLRLADGRGWACDDSAVMPHNPSVVRGMWATMGMSPTGVPSL